MQRLSESGLAAIVMVGAAVALAPLPARAQSITPIPGLLGSPAPGVLDAGAMSPRPLLGAGTTFEFPGAYPPGFGAGSTGFVSSGVFRRKARPRPGQPRPPPRPSAIAPNVPAGAAGLRPWPQLMRHGAPFIEEPPGIAQPVIVTPPRRPVVDPAPFDPTGIREGSFVLRPAIEISGGYDSNPQHISPAKGAPELLVAPELTGHSDWERHELDLNIRGTYLAYGANFPESPTSLDRPTLDARVSGRIDATSDDRLLLEGRTLMGTDYPGSPNITAGLLRLPIVTTVGATFGYVHDFNRFEISTKTTIDRNIWGDSSLTDGTTSPNTDRNLTQYAEILRGSYELLPGVRPFVETSIDTRIHDIAVDRTGADRDSQAETVSAGSSFDFTGRLTGEASVGYTQREFKSEFLPNISGVVFDSKLVYAATPLTALKFNAISGTGELIVPGASGVLRRDFIFEADHDFRRWLTGVVKFGYGADSYFGLDRFDNRYSAGVGVIYKLTRELWLKADYRHEWLRSTDTPANYDADVVLMTLRLQR